MLYHIIHNHFQEYSINVKCFFQYPVACWQFSAAQAECLYGVYLRAWWMTNGPQLQYNHRNILLLMEFKYRGIMVTMRKWLTVTHLDQKDDIATDGSILIVIYQFNSNIIWSLNTHLMKCPCHNFLFSKTQNNEVWLLKLDNMNEELICHPRPLLTTE